MNETESFTHLKTSKFLIKLIIWKNPFEKVDDERTLTVIRQR